MNAVTRKRAGRASPCSCGCGVMLLPDTLCQRGNIDGEPVAFAGVECFARHLENMRGEPACACGAPSEQQCECDEQAPFDHDPGPDYAPDVHGRW